MIRLTTNHDTPREPEDVRVRMGMWREGLISIPRRYVTYHKNLAEQELAAISEEYGVTIHDARMESDGWLDGMKVLVAVAETGAGRLLKIKWHDSNRAFMRKAGGGWVTLRRSDLL